MVFNVSFGKMLRASSEAIVALAERGCLVICAVRAIVAHISTAQRMRWGLTAWNIFPVVWAEGGRGSLPLSAAGIATTLQGHLRAAELSRATSRCALSRVEGSVCNAMAGTVVDEKMKLGAWETVSVANYYIGAISSGNVHGSKRERGQSYADASKLPSSPDFEKYFEACAGLD